MTVTRQAEDVQSQARHLLQDEFLGVGDMRGFYDRCRLLPTSTNADISLIRSHVAYWSGSAEAERAVIRPSRGHSYRLKAHGMEFLVRISDHYDHRNGVAGWTQ